MSNIKIITLTCLLITVSIVFSQEKTIDNAYLKCQYEHTYLKDTLDISTKNDLLILQIGENLSKSYSYYTFQIDSLVKTPDGDKVWKEIFDKSLKDWKIHRDRSKWMNSFPRVRNTTYVYKNYPAGSMTITDRIGSDRVIYEDNLNAQNWQITDSVKTVLGYECQQATCNFRGRPFNVNDYNCEHLGGVSGNAGVFSNICDLTKYAQMLLCGGSPIVDKEIFEMAVKNYTPKHDQSRALGFLYVDEKYDQTGKLFPKGSIGHCGHTGQSLFVHPGSGLYAIILTDATATLARSSNDNSYDYSVVCKMRQMIHNAIAEDIGRDNKNLKNVI